METYINLFGIKLTPDTTPAQIKVAAGDKADAYLTDDGSGSVFFNESLILCGYQFHAQCSFLSGKIRRLVLYPFSFDDDTDNERELQQKYWKICKVVLKKLFGEPDKIEKDNIFYKLPYGTARAVTSAGYKELTDDGDTFITITYTAIASSEGE